LVRRACCEYSKWCPILKKLILIGGGGHCKSCIDVIEQTGQYEIIGILDKQRLWQFVLGYKIIGTDDCIESLVTDGYQFLVTIGQIKSPKLKESLFNKLKICNANIATIISPRAYVSKYARVDEGTIIMHDVLVNANAQIGKNCIINTKALIEHDAIIGDHCHISTAAIINGGTEIKHGSFFGSNATSKDNVTSPEVDFIKAGAVYKGLKNV
jgi:sugar O-acyltransferase (sialic acid O-acetyltransferase NeuD family)